MLESEIKKLTAAVTELTAALHTVRLPATDSATSAVAPTTEETPQPVPVVAQPPAPKLGDWGPAETKAPPVADPAAVADLVKDTPTTAAVPTKKQLVEKFIELAQSKDREVAVKLLADFGVGNLPELTDKTKWPEFIAAVDVLLAG